MSLDPFEQRFQILLDIKVTYQKDKLVATQPSENILFTAEVSESFCDLDKKTIADLVAEVVIHILEPIKIKKEKCGIGMERIGF
jgi:hypothetical protein